MGALKKDDQSTTENTESTEKAESMMQNLHYQELTGRIRQIAFDTHKYFGNGFLEKVYENSMRRRMRDTGINVLQQVPIDVLDEDGSVAGEYFADLDVEEKILIEVKAVKALNDQHKAQIIHYLKATRRTLGILVDFGAAKLEFKRFIETRHRP